MTSTEIKLSKKYLTRELLPLPHLGVLKSKSRLIMNRDSINPFTQKGTYILNFDVLADLIIAICKSSNVPVVSVSCEILSCDEPYIQTDIVFDYLGAYLSKHGIDLYKQPRYFGDGYPIQGTYIYISSIGIRSSLAGGYINDFAIQAYLHKGEVYTLHRQYEADYVLGLGLPYDYESPYSVEYKANRKYKI